MVDNSINGDDHIRNHLKERKDHLLCYEGTDFSDASLKTYRKNEACQNLSSPPGLDPGSRGIPNMWVSSRYNLILFFLYHIHRQ